MQAQDSGGGLWLVSVCKLPHQMPIVARRTVMVGRIRTPAPLELAPIAICIAHVDPILLIFYFTNI